jgi:hypothetical protein
VSTNLDQKGVAGGQNFRRVSKGGKEQATLTTYLHHQDCVQHQPDLKGILSDWVLVEGVVSCLQVLLYWNLRFNWYYVCKILYVRRTVLVDDPVYTQDNYFPSMETQVIRILIWRMRQYKGYLNASYFFVVDQYCYCGSTFSQETPLSVSYPSVSFIISNVEAQPNVTT